MYSCWQGLWGIICCLSLLLGMASCQDFTDDTGRTMPEPDLKFADGTLNLPLEEKEYTVDIESNLPWRVKTCFHRTGWVREVSEYRYPRMRM